MSCPHCQSTFVRRRSERTALGYQRFSFGSCRRRFNERTGTPFNELQYPTDVVLLAVLSRLRYWGRSSAGSVAGWRCACSS